MNPQLKMLLWKEWRERRDQLFLCLALAGACALCAAIWSFGRLVSGYRPDRFPWEIIAWFYSLVMPLFVAMRTACGEMTDHTLAFSLGLPLAPRRAAWIRLLGGATLLVVPPLIIAILASLGLAVASLIDFKMARELAGIMPVSWARLPMFWFNMGLFAVATVGCYMQLTLLGTLVRSENRLALLGAAWTIVCIFAGLVSGIEAVRGHWIEVFSPQTAALVALVAATMDADQLTRDPSLWSAARYGWLLAGNLVAIGLLAVWFVRRYSRRIADAGQPLGWRLSGRGLPALPAWQPWPLERIRATQWGALAWLALRQSLPMCLGALAIALVVSLLAPLIDVALEHHSRNIWQAVGGIFAMVMLMVGVLWASVVGVGSAADELDARSGDFWRTRPIPFWRMFTIKFLVGLVVVVGVLDGPVLAISSLAGGKIAGAEDSTWAYIACLFPLHAAMFAMALAWACLLRRVAVGAMAAIVSIGAVALAGVVIPALQQLNPFVVYDQLIHEANRHGKVIDLTSSSYPLMAAVLVLTIALSFVVGGLALAAYQPGRRLS